MLCIACSFPLILLAKMMMKGLDWSKTLAFLHIQECLKRLKKQGIWGDVFVKKGEVQA